MNIVLIGMRGAGKTTVAKILAKKLRKPYLEIDTMIAKKAGMTISEIVKNHGWEYFRDLESNVIHDTGNTDNVIISCGGGAVVRAKNVTILKQNSKLFWLQVSVDTLLKRISNDKNRPSLTGKSPKQDMEETLKERHEFYKNIADVVIDTENLDAQKVAERIIEKL